jgi:Undecaprenyl-phosphate glucose phosphotransferase
MALLSTETSPSQARSPYAPAGPAIAEGANRRGPFRPARLASVRERLSGPTLVRLFRGLDALVIVGLALMVAGFQAEGRILEATLSALAPLAAGAAVSLWATRLFQGYALGPRETLPRHLLRAAAAALCGGLTAIATGLAAGPSGQAGALDFAVLALAGLAASHGLAWSAVRHWRAQGRLTPNIVVVGATKNAARLIESALKSREANVLGIFDDRLERAPSEIHGVPVLGDTKALLDHKVLPFVDRIVITVTSSAQARVRDLITRLQVLPNAIILFVDVEGQDTRDATLSRLADAPLTQVSGVGEDERRAFYKRLQDLALGVLALVPALPVMLLVALAVRLDSPGPVLFRQRRHGFNNEVITVWKFRSMRREASDPTAKRQVTADDDRVTRVGRFIRKTSLDELPQLFNVLTGKMSLVGPRPHPIGMITAGEESARLVSEYAWRHRMKPGITGWAQINGSRGPVHTAEEVRRRVVLDVEYIERQSFLFDVYILLMTLPRLLGDRDAVR